MWCHPCQWLSIQLWKLRVFFNIFWNDKLSAAISVKYLKSCIQYSACGPFPRCYTIGAIPAIPGSYIVNTSDYAFDHRRQPAACSPHTTTLYHGKDAEESSDQYSIAVHTHGKYAHCRCNAKYKQTLSMTRSISFIQGRAVKLWMWGSTCYSTPEDFTFQPSYNISIKEETPMVFYVGVGPNLILSLGSLLKALV